MSPRSDFTEEEKKLLNAVQQGMYDNVTRIPPKLEGLATAGLIELGIISTLPVLPTRYRVQLTEQGKKVLHS